MSDTSMTEPGPASDAVDEELHGRRSFLVGLGRWSKIVIGAAVFGGLALPESDAEAGWVNRHGGGGGGWVNRHGGGGGGWVNRHGGGFGGGGWVNRHGGGGWVNRHRGGSWINRR
ncbi:hypothetical protein [uncultured Thiodictyon sp.]|uniref:hypothetical protein n=1 Tax=uncultured Thiodictyon sp. TaxID=1846217 RepID=UPI0025F7270B|nr:hypothetical protein [uncultured Thiodictyon sp.]